MDKRLGMVIDLQACTGCNTCSVACKQENNLPEGVWWTQVITLGDVGEDSTEGEFPNLRLDYLPLACQQCVEAPCVEICPSTATFRNEQGIVDIEPGLCGGCRYCMMVCPYTGVRVFAADKLRYSIPYPTGGNPILHRPKTVEKCTFCSHRVGQGMLPACVDSCPVQARVFGDLNDPQSEAAILLRNRPHFQLLTEKGTQPSVYYLP